MILNHPAASWGTSPYTAWKEKPDTLNERPCGCHQDIVVFGHEVRCPEVKDASDKGGNRDDRNPVDG